MEIKKITILGANGTMGRNVAGIFASFGETYVYMVSRTKKKSEEAIEKAAKSVRADSIKSNMEARDYSELEYCIRESDLIFESITEDECLKEKLLSDISKYLSADTLICSGTSGLSIDKMAEILPPELRKNYFGMHFFNPPYNMTLCELISTKYATDECIQAVKRFLEEKLIRTVVLVKDLPAFMGNRIGFYLINMALQHAEKYKERGGVDYIDSIMGPFTGRNMAPIRTADFVGLDVHKAIVNNVYDNTNDYAKEIFSLPIYVENLVQNGKLGYKVHEGLYKTFFDENGRKKHMVYDIQTNSYREVKEYNIEFAADMVQELEKGLYESAARKLVVNSSDEAMICKKFLIQYVVYSLYINRAVGNSVYDADDAMATGFSWIPPLAVIEFLGGKTVFEKLVTQLLTEEEISMSNIKNLLLDCPKSKYDYRKYLKAKR